MNICFKALIQKCGKVCEVEENSAAINQAENKKRQRSFRKKGNHKKQ